MLSSRHCRMPQKHGHGMQPAITNTSCGNELHEGACGVSRWDRESNEDMYRRFGMSETTVGMDCGVVEWVEKRRENWGRIG